MLHHDPLDILRDVEIIIRQVPPSVIPVGVRLDPVDLQAKNFRELLTKNDVRNMIEPGSVPEIQIVDIDKVSKEMVRGKHVVLMLPSHQHLVDSALSYSKELELLFEYDATISIATLDAHDGHPGTFAMNRVAPQYIPCLRMEPVRRLIQIHKDLAIAQGKQEELIDTVAGSSRAFAPNSPSYTHALSAQLYHNNYHNSLRLLLRSERADFATSIRNFPATSE